MTANKDVIDEHTRLTSVVVVNETSGIVVHQFSYWLAVS